MHLPVHLSMQTLISVSVVLTVLTPYISAIFTQDHLPQWANELIAMIISIGAGVISFFVSGGVFNTTDAPSLGLAISGIFVGAKLYYVHLLPNSPLIKTIEYATGGAASGAVPPDTLQAATVSSTPTAVVSSLPGDPLPSQPTDTPEVTQGN